MIEYLEIRGADTNILGILDTAKSIIWHSVYFGVGDFEIYAAASPENLNLLLSAEYVTRPDNSEVGIIEGIRIEYNEQDGRVIIASGRFAKSLLDRRLIYNLSGKTNTPTVLSGNVENAVRGLVQNNAIACAFDSKRNINVLQLGAVANIPLRIVSANGNPARKQVSYANLLTYTDGVLEEYGLSSLCILSEGKLKYTVFQGRDRSKDNTSGNAPVVFSQEYDNLTSSNYEHDTATEKNVILIGGEGEGLDRFYSLVDTAGADLARREMFLDASSISKTYKDESEVEQTYTDAEYKEMLDTAGKQELSAYTVTELFDGTIDTSKGSYIFGRDFELGDIVTVQDNEIGVYKNVRICETTEVQDENGYNVDVIYK